MSGGAGANDVGKASARVKASSARELQANSEGARAPYLRQVLAGLKGDKSAIPGIKGLMAGTELGRSRAIADTEALANKTGLTSAQGRSITAPLSIQGANTSANTSDALLQQYAAAAPGLAVQRTGANAAARKASNAQAETAAGGAAAAITIAVAAYLI